MTLPNRYFFSIIFLFLGSTGLFAGKYYDLTPTAKSAYDKIHCLRFDEATIDIQKLKREEPDNLIVGLVEDHLDFLKVLISSDEFTFKNLEKNKNTRLDALSKGDKSSPYHLFSQAVIRLHWAVLNGKYNKYLAAINDVKQSYGLLTENQKKFPNFKANLLPLGVMHALIGTVPEEYRWAVKLVGGMEGSVNQGISEVEQVIDFSNKNPSFPFGDEALVTYSFLLMHLGNDAEKGWKAIHKSGLKPKENPLAAFAIANLAIKTARNDVAIKTLEEMPTGGAFYPFPYKNFLLGLAKLYRLDTDANKPLETWVANQVSVFYVKEGYQKLAWYHLINGNQNGYNYYINFCKTRGSDRIETDKVAEREAENGEVPNPKLLRARLLFDGGYFQRAFDYLSTKENLFTQKREQLEFGYRMGRISQKLDKQSEAIAYFNKTMNNGWSEPYYFACNSALQTGLIYEGQKNYAKAREYYKKCLEMSPDEYATSLHQKAKTGLSRIKGKK